MARLFRWPLLSRSQAARAVIPNRRADHRQIPEPPSHRQQQQEASPSSEARSCRKSPAFLAQGAHTGVRGRTRKPIPAVSSRPGLKFRESSLPTRCGSLPPLGSAVRGCCCLSFRSGCPSLLEEQEQWQRQQQQQPARVKSELA